LLKRNDASSLGTSARIMMGHNIYLILIIWAGVIPRLKKMLKLVSYRFVTASQAGLYT
jgi:hypothetical protein